MAFVTLTFASAAAVASGVAVSLPTTATFDDYAAAFGRTFRVGSPEYGQREALFEKRAEEIRAQNERSAKLWTAGFNEFTDRTDDELALLRGWRGLGPRGQGNRRETQLLDTQVTIKDSIDWSHLKSLKDVQDQGACGSCWAFATASMLWAHYEIQTNETKFFSPQQLVDCTPNPKKCGGTGGCAGATVELAMGYVESIGIDKLKTTTEMIYDAQDHTCEKEFQGKFDGNFRGVAPHRDGTLATALLGWSTLPSNEALPLMNALMDGPVAISASADGWFSYMGGVFDGCPKDSVIDHAILAIGFGEESGTKYWTIRNSWGEYFGESGNIRILRGSTPSNDQAYCGIDHKPEDGVACEPYPDQVEVCGMCGMLYDSVAPKFGKVSSSKALRGK